MFQRNDMSEPTIVSLLVLLVAYMLSLALVGSAHPLCRQQGLQDCADGDVLIQDCMVVETIALVGNCSHLSIRVVNVTVNITPISLRTGWLTVNTSVWPMDNISIDVTSSTLVGTIDMIAPVNVTFGTALSQLSVTIDSTFFSLGAFTLRDMSAVTNVSVRITNSRQFHQYEYDWDIWLPREFTACRLSLLCVWTSLAQIGGLWDIEVSNVTSVTKQILTWPGMGASDHHSLVIRGNSSAGDNVISIAITNSSFEHRVLPRIESDDRFTTHSSLVFLHFLSLSAVTVRCLGVRQAVSFSTTSPFILHETYTLLIQPAADLIESTVLQIKDNPIILCQPLTVVMVNCVINLRGTSRAAVFGISSLKSAGLNGSIEFTFLDSVAVLRVSGNVSHGANPLTPSVALIRDAGVVSLPLSSYLAGLDVWLDRCQVDMLVSVDISDTHDENPLFSYQVSLLSTGGVARLNVTMSRSRIAHALVSSEVNGTVFITSTSVLLATIGAASRLAISQHVVIRDCEMLFLCNVSKRFGTATVLPVAITFGVVVSSVSMAHGNTVPAASTVEISGGSITYDVAPLSVLSFHNGTEGGIWISTVALSNQQTAVLRRGNLNALSHWFLTTLLGDIESPLYWTTLSVTIKNTVVRMLEALTPAAFEHMKRTMLLGDPCSVFCNAPLLLTALLFADQSFVAVSNLTIVDGPQTGVLLGPTSVAPLWGNAEPPSTLQSNASGGAIVWLRLDAGFFHDSVVEVDALRYYGPGAVLQISGSNGAVGLLPAFSPLLFVLNGTLSSNLTVRVQHCVVRFSNCLGPSSSLHGSYLRAAILMLVVEDKVSSIVEQTWEVSSTNVSLPSYVPATALTVFPSVPFNRDVFDDVLTVFNLSCLLLRERPLRSVSVGFGRGSFLQRNVIDVCNAIRVSQTLQIDEPLSDGNIAGRGASAVAALSLMSVVGSWPAVSDIQILSSITSIRCVTAKRSPNPNGAATLFYSLSSPFGDWSFVDGLAGSMALVGGVISLQFTLLLTVMAVRSGGSPMCSVDDSYRLKGSNVVTSMFGRMFCSPYASMLRWPSFSFQVWTFLAPGTCAISVGLLGGDGPHLALGVLGLAWTSLYFIGAHAMLVGTAIGKAVYFDEKVIERASSAGVNAWDSLRLRVMMFTLPLGEWMPRHDRIALFGKVLGGVRGEFKPYWWIPTLLACVVSGISSSTRSDTSPGACTAALAVMMALFVANIAFTMRMHPSRILLCDTFIVVTMTLMTLMCVIQVLLLFDQVEPDALTEVALAVSLCNMIRALHSCIIFLVERSPSAQKLVVGTLGHCVVRSLRQGESVSRQILHGYGRRISFLGVPLVPLLVAPGKVRGDADYAQRQLIALERLIATVCRVRLQGHRAHESILPSGSLRIDDGGDSALRY